jgi:hypothetical protein
VSFYYYSLQILQKVSGFSFPENRISNTIFLNSRDSKLPQLDELGMDSDVLEEATKIRVMKNLEIADQCMVLRDLTKFYKKIPVVNRLCVIIDHASCFGLLGKK